MEPPERDSRKRLGSPPRGSNKRLKRHEDDVDGVRISREYATGGPISPPRRSQRSSTSFYASQDGREFGKWDIEQPTNHVQRGYVSTYNGHGHGRRPNRGGNSRGRVFEDVGLGPCVRGTEVEYGSPKQNASTVRVSNVLYSWDVAKLVQHMAQCGKVVGARLVVKDGRVTGKAFVTFHNTVCAERAVSTLAGTMVDGRELMVAPWRHPGKDIREMTASDHDVSHEPAGPASVASAPTHTTASGASGASDNMAVDPPVASSATPDAAPAAPEPTSGSARDPVSAASLPAEGISQSEEHAGRGEPDTASEAGGVESTQADGQTSESQSKDIFAPNAGACDAASAAERKEVPPVPDAAEPTGPEPVPEPSSKRGSARRRSRSGKARSVGRGAEGEDATKVETPVPNGAPPAELAQVSPKSGQRRARPKKKKATTPTKRSESQASPQRKAALDECDELSSPTKASPLKGQRTLDSFMSRSSKTIAMLRVKEIHDAPEVCMLDPLHVSGAFSPPKSPRKKKKECKDTGDMQVEGHDEGQPPSKSIVEGVEKQSKSSARRKQKAKPEEISKALEKKAKNRAPGKRGGGQTSTKKAKKAKKAKKVTTAATTKTSEQETSLKKAGKKKASGKKRQPSKSAVEKEPRGDSDDMVVEEEHEGAPLDNTLSVSGSGDEEYVPPTKKEERPKKAKRKRKDGERNKLRFESAKTKPEPDPDPEPEQKHFTKVITLGDTLDKDLCEACGCAGKLLVRCTVCASPFHRFCLDLRCDTEQLIENWRCPDCKVCEVCNDPGQGEKMVVCDICDGGFHIFCLKAPLPTIPDRAWLCEDCGMCIGCGEMTHHVPDRSVLKDLTYNPPPKDRVTPVCPSCEVKFGLKYFCHMCNRTYSYDDSDVEMVCCSKCDEWVHNTCDNITDEEYEMLGGDNYSYFCPECRERDDSLQRITHGSEEGVKAKKVFEQAGFFRLKDVAEESPPSEKQAKKKKKKSGAQRGKETEADRDPRKCELCRLGGDREEVLETCLQRTDLATSQIEGRLIPIGVDQWVHVQCALWSSEVEIDDRGLLQRARSAVRRNLSMRCEFCKEKGGTMGCWVESCKNTFHFGCALKARCLLGLETRSLYCKKHAKHKKKPDDVFVIPCESQFEEFHRSLQTTAQSFLVNQNPKYPKERFKLRVGSYTLVATGQINLAPGYHTAKYIYPVGFSGIRRFWSMKNPTETTDYRCTILLGPVFCIEPLDAKNTASECIYAGTPTEAWAEVTSAIDKTQTNASLRISGLKSGEFLFGLGLPWVMDILEELPGADECISYKFQSGRRGNDLAENPSGCARCEPFQKTSIQKRITSRAPRVTDADDTRYQSPVVESGIKNRDLLTASFGSSRAELSARFGYYLRTPRKVRIGKSHIHSFGLFAKAHIVPNEIILEYTGETIRQIVADLREQENELRGVDCYLFRIDDDCIIDATWKGNLARFANHSCGPNAAARKIIYDGSPRIVLIAMDYIRPGEEITYDYKFSFEEGEEKVPCLCGAPNCRGSMN